MSALDCSEVLPHLESYRRGDASPELAVLVDDHLSRCPECRRRLAYLKQVTAMLSAWRPRRVPADLKIEIAEAVSEPLGQEARKRFVRGRRPPSPPRRRLPALSAAQKTANALALAALVFLAAVILYRLWQVHCGAPASRQVSAGHARPAESGLVLRLVRVEPSDEDREPPTAQAARLVALVAQVTGLPTQEAEGLLARLPVTLRRGLTADEARRLRSRLEALGGVVEIVSPSGESSGAP